MYDRQLRLCPPDEIRCPRCGAVRRRFTLGRHSYALFECEGKVANSSRYCGLHLFVHRGVDKWCGVNALTAAEKDEIVRQIEALEGGQAA